MQVVRLYEARARVLESHQEVLAKNRFETEDSWPYFVMEAEAHFVLVSARQLLRALTAFDGNDPLPPHMDEATVIFVRDAREHWDDPMGRSAKQAAQRGVNPESHLWSRSGRGILGELVDDAALRDWAMSVSQEIESWDPWSTPT